MTATPASRSAALPDAPVAAAIPEPEATPTAPELTEARLRFISLWSRMASTWGISRTMAEVHAYLFIRGGEHHAEDVMEGVGISRGNASMTLRRLEEWELITRVHRRGDRKEYFAAERDVWRMFRTILIQRKKRELDPLLGELDGCRLGDPSEGTVPGPGPVEDDPADPAAAHDRRIADLAAFLEFADAMASQLLGLDASDAAGPDARRLAAAAAVGASIPPADPHSGSAPDSGGAA